MTEAAAYREWLNTGTTNRGVLETIEVWHSSFNSLYLANNDVAVTCTIQDGLGSGSGSVLFQPTRFLLEPTETSDSTEQGTSIAMSSLDGLIYNELKGMSPENRRLSILIIPRIYWTTSTTTQLINPAPVWTLHNVKATPDVVRGDIRAAPLRVHRTGIYYTALEFKILNFAR